MNAGERTDENEDDGDDEDDREREGLVTFRLERR